MFGLHPLLDIDLDRVKLNMICDITYQSQRFLADVNDLFVDLATIQIGVEVFQEDDFLLQLRGVVGKGMLCHNVNLIFASSFHIFELPN